jgi:hypothetical protein
VLLSKYKSGVAVKRLAGQTGRSPTQLDRPAPEKQFKRVLGQAQSVEHEPAGPDHPLKILVIDNEVLIRRALRGVLAQLKRDVLILEASDCTKAAPLLDDNADLDLILLDL